jgi:hypothetical protein
MMAAQRLCAVLVGAETLAELVQDANIGDLILPSFRLADLIHGWLDDVATIDSTIRLEKS